ncbi:hypothetical protein D1872_319840 [compost metagenome]
MKVQPDLDAASGFADIDQFGFRQLAVDRHVVDGFNFDPACHRRVDGVAERFFSAGNHK